MVRESIKAHKVAIQFEAQMRDVREDKARDGAMVRRSTKTVIL